MFQSFVVPRFLDESGNHRVTPYEKIFDDLAVGLSSAEADVRVAQSPKVSFLAAPPDHHFLLDLTVLDTADTKWISLEFELDPVRAFNAARMTLLISLAANVARGVGVDLRLVRGDGSFEDLHFGGANTSQDGKMVSQNLSQPIDGLKARLSEAPKAATLLLFVPVETDFALSLAMLNVHYSDM